jgi:DNA replication protein DnaC
VRELQKAARQERIQKLIAQADLNPDWIFDKMDSGDPALQYPIETARYFISGFEHWEKSGGLHADLRRLRHRQIHPGGCRGP